MDRTLLKDFWNCGDNEIIEFAILRARLNAREKEIINYTLDLCYTQEKTAEMLDISVRQVQSTWYSACDKLLNIPWVTAYAKEIKNKKDP